MPHNLHPVDKIRQGTKPTPRRFFYEAMGLSMDWIALGQKYRHLRSIRNLTIRNAAQKAQISHQIWDFIERAQRNNVLVSTLESMANALDARLVIDMQLSPTASDELSSLVNAAQRLSSADIERVTALAEILENMDGLTLDLVRSQVDSLILLLRAPRVTASTPIYVHDVSVKQV